MAHTHFQKILILPDAGPENPFQYQLIEFLRSHGFNVSIGSNRKLGSIYKAVNQFNPDIVYFDWVHSYIIGKTFLWSCVKSLFFVSEIFYLRFFSKIPIIHTLHNIQNHGEFWLAWEQLIYGFFLRRCTKIRVYSEAVKQDAVYRFGITTGSFYIIQDIPYHYFYQNNTSQKDSRTFLNLDKTGFIFLFFGKIKKYKGLDKLIQAFKLIAKPVDYLLIAGDCSDQKYLSDLQKLTNNCPRIIWHAQFIAKDEVQFFFNAANVVVLPFTRIDHSGSIDLAMSFATPVITLKTDATSDLLAHQEQLLFKNQQELESCMTLVREINLGEIGTKNFQMADSASYEDLLQLFEKV